jgi:hypothetical protein
MGTSKNKWLYPVLLSITFFLVVLLIVLSSMNKLQLPLPVYFLSLLICDLAITAFLTGWLSSSAEWSGTFMKGNMKLTGSVVVFLLVLGVGYKYRPIVKDDLFDFTVILVDPKGGHPNFSGDTVQMTFDNLVRNQPVNADGQAIFLGIAPKYKGEAVHLIARLDRFRIGSNPDTLITIPAESTPSVRLPVFPMGDTILFEGLLLHRNTAKQPIPIVDAMIKFTSFDKTIKTDSLGQFALYLPAKTGDIATIMISKKQKWIFTGDVTLSKNMQILADE